LRYRDWVTIETTSAPSTQVWSADARVTFRPSATYRELGQKGDSSGKWKLVRRPLFLALFLASMVSLIASQRLTLRLMITGAINMSFIPLVEFAGLRATWRRRYDIPFSRAVDLFFMSHGPWILWLLAYASIWAFASPDHAFFWTAPRFIWPTFIVAIAWSASIDYCFFREVFHRSRAQSAFDLCVQRAVSWTLGILIFGADPLAPELTRILHL
jgi:hypothetical protein